MTVTSDAPPFVVRRLLFDGGDGTDLLAKVIDERALAGRLERLSQTVRAAAGTDLAEVTQGLLDLELADLALVAWRKHRDLAAAAARTVDHPGTTEVVELATHRIVSVHKPSVELLVDGVRVGLVHLELRAELLVKGLVATVRLGHLVALRSGSFDVRLSLAVEGLPVVARQAQLPSPLFVRLGDGVPLTNRTDAVSLH